MHDAYIINELFCRYATLQKEMGHIGFMLTFSCIIAEAQSQNQSRKWLWHYPWYSAFLKKHLLQKIKEKAIKQSIFSCHEGKNPIKLMFRLETKHWEPHELGSCSRWNMKVMDVFSFLPLNINIFGQPLRNWLFIGLLQRLFQYGHRITVPRHIIKIAV